MRSRTLTSLLASAAAGCLALGVLAAPASAAPKEIQYYALGDSYSAGLGNGDYPYYVSFADKLDAKKYVDGHKLAVPGATSGEVLSGQIPALVATTGEDLVTITVGGNDVAWVDLLTVCHELTDECSTTLAEASETLRNELPANLSKLFMAIKTYAPEAKVLVLGYPHLFTPAPADPMTPTYMLVNAATDSLNSVIKGVTDAAGAEFEFVDVTARFEGHGANTDDPWINPYPATGPAAVPLHPNAKGQQAYYAAVRSTGNLG